MPRGSGRKTLFRVCAKWLANNDPDAIRRNLSLIPTYRRWDDLYVFIGTPLEKDVFDLMKQQLAKDVVSETPSLLAKWLKSENTSSEESRELGNKTRIAFGMSHKQYRKTLAILRKRINVLERLMSENKWNEIEFDKIPSRAGFIYRDAFIRHDADRGSKESYADFAQNKSKTVNAKVLYPYECVDAALKSYRAPLDDTNRLMVNKYWDNLENYFKEASFNGMAIVDVSGSMYGSNASAPLNVAISLGLYCAEKAKGPYNGHFITFSSNPSFVKVEGVDFVDKVYRMYNAEWGGSTNVEAAFDLMLDVALKNHLSQSDIPENLIIISDMEFDACVTYGSAKTGSWSWMNTPPDETLFETMAKRWANYGYKMPKLVFWNAAARNNNIPMRDNGRVSYVSGMSPSIFQSIMTGKTGADLMFEKLDSPRYECIK